MVALYSCMHSASPSLTTRTLDSQNDLVPSAAQHVASGYGFQMPRLGVYGSKGQKAPKHNCFDS